MIRFTGATARLANTTAIDFTSGLSCIIRGIIDTAAAQKDIIAFGNGASNGCALYLEGGAGDMSVYATSALTIAQPQTVSIDTTPMTLGFTYDNTTMKLFFNGKELASGARALSAMGFTGIRVGLMSAPCAMSLQSLKIWNDCLTPGEMLIESCSDAAIKTDTLLDAWPLLDLTGGLTGENGTVLTASGATLAEIADLPRIEIYSAPVASGGGLTAIT